MFRVLKVPRVLLAELVQLVQLDLKVYKAPLVPKAYKV